MRERWAAPKTRAVHRKGKEIFIPLQRTAPTQSGRVVPGPASLGVALVVGLLAACTTPEAGLGGLGLPRQHPGEEYPGARMAITGVFQVADDGCFQLLTKGNRVFVIWPPGAAEDGPLRIRFRDGSVLQEGDVITGTGAYTPVAPLVADRNGYWATTLGFCAPEADEVIVLDDASRGPAWLGRYRSDPLEGHGH